jgi:hypothetical protein
MLDGLHHVWRAAEMLAGEDAGLRDRLKAVRAPLLLALARPDQWPPDLLSVARSVERLVRVRGGADPLDSMGDDLARQVAEDFLSLAFDVQAAFAREACQVTSPLPAAGRAPSGAFPVDAHDLPSMRSTAQQPRTCGPALRQ